MFLGIVWLLVDFCLKFRKSRPTCVVATIVSIAVYGFFWWLIYIPAPLAFTVINPPNNYPVGTTVLGVLWKPEYHPVRVIIANETGHEYINFDAYIGTNNMFMTQPGQSTGINQCLITPELPDLALSGLTMSVRDPKGLEISIPLPEDNASKFSKTYRIRCDKIAPRSGIEVLLPVIGPEQPMWVAINAQYEAAGLTRTPFIPKCLLSECDRVILPKSLTDP